MTHDATILLDVLTAKAPSSQRNAEADETGSLAACVSERDEALDESTMIDHSSSIKETDVSHPRTTNSTNADGGASGSEQTGNAFQPNQPNTARRWKRHALPTLVAFGNRKRLVSDAPRQFASQTSEETCSSDSCRLRQPLGARNNECPSNDQEVCDGEGSFESQSDSAHAFTHMAHNNDDCPSDDQERAGKVPALRCTGDSAHALTHMAHSNDKYEQEQAAEAAALRTNGDSATQTSEETCSSDSCRLRQPHGAHSTTGDLMAERDAIIAGAVETLEYISQQDDADAYRKMEFQCKTALHHLRGDPKPPDPVYKNDGTIEQFEQIMELAASGASEQEISRRLNIGSSDPDPPDTS